MTAIAFTFSTNDFEYVVLSGTKLIPVLHSKGKIVLPVNHNIPQTVAWFETELELLINNVNPDIANYRLTVMRVTNNYVSNVYYGQAILNLLCHKKGIQVSNISPSSITVTKFDQPKGTNLTNYIEGLVGAQPAPWNKSIKTTALMALTLL